MDKQQGLPTENSLQTNMLPFQIQRADRPTTRVIIEELLAMAEATKSWQLAYTGDWMKPSSLLLILMNLEQIWVAFRVLQITAPV